MASANGSWQKHHWSMCLRMLAVLALISLAFMPLLASAATATDAGYTLQPPDALWQNNEWVWRLPVVQYIAGILGGFVLSLAAITFLAWRVVTAGHQPFREFLPVLLRNPFLWITTLAMAAMAGITTSGIFELLRSQIWESVSTLESMGLAGGGPIVVTGLLAIISKRTNAWVETARDALAGDADALDKLLNSARSSNWFSVLILDQYYVDQQKRIAALATSWEAGLVQKVVWESMDRAVDKDDMLPSQRDRVANILLDIYPSGSERSKFSCAKQAFRAALSVMTLDEIEQLLQAGERRQSAERRDKRSSIPADIDKRSDNVRRIGTAWKPAIREEAA